MPKIGNQKNSKFPLYFENFPSYILGAKWQRLETVFLKRKKVPIWKYLPTLENLCATNPSLKITFDLPDTAPFCTVCNVYSTLCTCTFQVSCDRCMLSL